MTVAVDSVWSDFVAQREAVTKAVITLGMETGRLCPPLSPPSDEDLDYLEATGELNPDSTYWDDEENEQSEVRRKAVNSCSPRYRRLVGHALDCALLMMRFSDAVDALFAPVTAGSETDLSLDESDGRKYTIDQLRGAWGAGYAKGSGQWETNA